MDANDARILLGFPPNSHPTPSQVKSAYKKKVWESHPDLFPSHEKPLAESKFKLISEAYACLLPGGREASSSVEYSRVVRTGVPRAQGGRKNHAMIKVPFIFLILGTVTLGGFNASRAYRRQKEAYPSHNPFLP
uniref:J domain-containing protein n=1 Tax=Lotus japonicus TaxID=34305 RepID=I3SMA7_LOTJA|nr:unknown [Lotus japonicus]